MSNNTNQEDDPLTDEEKEKIRTAAQIISTLAVQREATHNYSREKVVDIALEYTEILFNKVKERGK